MEFLLVTTIPAVVGFGLGFASGKYDYSPWLLLFVAVLGFPVALLPFSVPYAAFAIFLLGLIPSTAGFLFGFRSGTRDRRR